MDVQPAPAVEASVGNVTTPPAANTNAASSVPPPAAQTPTNNVPQLQEQSGIAPAIAKLFNGAIPHPTELNVSYRVEGNDLVTVFTDPKTGKEITQVPSEALLDLAKFFDQQSGVTFDKNA